MLVDVNHQINAVDRAVGSRTIEAGTASVVTISQVYDTSVEDLWDACTNPERIPRWFLPISGDLVLGGTYQLEGNAGGTIESCSPPESFSATWEYGGQVSWIELRLTAEGDKARFTLDHIALPDDRWTEFGPGAVGIGWDLSFVGLAKHLESGAAVDPQEGMEWTMSAAGAEFMTLSNDRWCAAAIAAGEDAAAAKAAADRTLAAYTAAPAEG
ncbi:SRPBCC family protein [Antrihabitans stalactiti]|uniref:SRPBCC family protein n=1 Tax=Antrihabitans stalactiti TaxID=2584121 RepID=A0A848KKW5_9NOCA|nr:SRPBCC family protein [Antrihabitans stalactiti]NMN97322.1 SRPBCC family protein [Antrihabitans stalactiti]